MKLKKSVKEQLIKRTEGIISLLLILVLVPFYSVAAILEEAGRYQSAYRGLDSAISASEMSVLAQYDPYLLNRFGLLAVNQDIDIDSTFWSYFQKQDTQDTRSFSLKRATTQADGLYPLADTAVLRQQIQEQAAIPVTAKVVMDFGEFSNIVSQLEGYNETFKTTNTLLSSMEKSLEGGIDSYNAQKDAKEQMGKVTDAKKQYDKKNSAFESSMQELRDHLATQRPDDEEGAAAWDSKKESLISAAKRSRDSYLSATTDTSSNISGLAGKIDQAVQKEIDAKESSKDILTKYGTALKDDANKGLKDEKKRVDDQIKSGDLSDSEKSAMQKESDKLQNQMDKNSNSNRIVQPKYTVSV